MNYLWCFAADGTTALAREYRVLLEAPPFAFGRVQAERSMITSFFGAWCSDASAAISAAATPPKHLVLLSLMTLNVATCMWTAAMSLLPKSLLKNVVVACTLCL